MHNDTVFEWAVVGAGPAGITAVGKLLDTGIDPQKIIWIDPAFQVGDFGKLWGAVNSNTTVQNFLDYLNGPVHFNYANQAEHFELTKKPKAGFALLKEVSAPLQWVTDQLMKKVICRKAFVDSLTVSDGAWQLHMNNKQLCAKKVILTIGSEPKSLDFPSVETVPLNVALDPEKLKKVCKQSEQVAVFGSSHSAIIIIQNLVELGVKSIVNFYRKPLRYAIRMNGWTLYDNTGLKGETAKWAHAHISQALLPNIVRYQATEDNIEHHMAQCHKAVYAVGFRRRNINVAGISLSDYDPSNGIIAPGLFGAGIAFPKAVTDPMGNAEYDVGLLKFLKTLDQVLPLWLQYPL